MSAIRVEVTAEDIAACAVVPNIGDGFKSTHPEGKDPVELAIGRVTGQGVGCDQDETTDMATIGTGSTILVVNLPPEQFAWIDRYYKGEPVEPFGFDIEIESWLVDLVRDDRPLLTLAEAAPLLGVTPGTLRQQAQREWNGRPATPRARRLGVVKLGRDWFVDRVAVEREAHP